jgi:hypothetical protein
VRGKDGLGVSLGWERGDTWNVYRLMVGKPVGFQSFWKTDENHINIASRLRNDDQREMHLAQ